MFCLSSRSQCDTLVDVSLPTSLLAAYAFMPRPASLSADARKIDYLSSQFKWNYPIKRLKDFVKSSNNVLVITNKNEEIQWVSQGFSQMTGYKNQEAIGQKPSFLQGKQTDPLTKMAIRNCINTRSIFEGTILNFRKNGEPYYCKVEIAPIFDRKNELSHFVALEFELV